MRKSLKKSLWLMFVVVVSIVLLSACGDGESASKDNGGSAGNTNVGEENVNNNEGNADETPEEPTKISIMTILHTPETPDDKVLNEIEKAANVELDIEWVPDNNYADKLNTAFATGTFPQVVTMNNPHVDQFKEAIRDGQFWEIGPYIDEFENLSKLKPEILDNVRVEGKIYSIYQGRPLSRQGVIYRKDWADNLGLEAPTNVDEFFEMARAFTEDDPNGSGKDDTIGLTDRGDLIYGAFKTIASWFHTPNEWGEKDGELLPEFMFDEYMEAMKFMRELRENGYMNKDFPVTSKEDQQAMFKNGTAGIYVGAMVDVLSMYNDAIELNPDLEYDVQNRIEGPDGEFTVWAIPGYGSQVFFPKSAIETEEELKAILAFYDKMMTPELANLAKWGIEDEHYTVQDGYAVQTDDQGKYEREVLPFNMLTIGEPETNGELEAFHEYEVRQKATELINDNENYLIHNPTLTLESETDIRDGDRLQTIIDDATYNFMLGEIDEDGFYAEVEKWKEQGGNDIIREYNEARDALQ